MVLAGLCSRGPNVNNKEMRMEGQGGQKEVSKCSLNLDHKFTCDFRATRDVRDHQPPNYKRENQAWQGHMIWWRID